MTDDRFDPSVLHAYEVPEPSSDLADRFLERWSRGGHDVAPVRRRWPIALGAALLIACTVLVTLWVVRAPRYAAPDAGAVAVAARQQIRLPSGDVAVAEPGSQLHWKSDGHGTVRVEQTRGSVFYRVDPIRRFTVETATTKVATTGTCFAVAVGHDADIVTVYEGTVIVSSAGGTTRLAAGEQARTTKTAKPQLVATDEARELRERVAALQAEVASLHGSSLAAADHDNAQFDFSADKLAALARDCDVPFDLPPLPGSTVMDQFLEQSLTKTHFSAAERSAVMRVSERWQASFEAEIRALYRELTGEAGDSLDPLTILMEIIQKSTPAEILAAQKVVARERAGLRPAPADPKLGSVMERFFRIGIKAGDEFERALAREISAARAREFRRTWGEINVGPGCPGGEPAR